MRVLLVNRNDYVDGGADRVFLNTYDGLQVSGYRLQVDKFTRSDVDTLSFASPKDLSLIGKIRSIGGYLYNKKVARKLENKIQNFKPDVAHVHLIFGTLSLSVLKVLKKHKVPVVMTVHDYRLICPVNAMLDRHGKVCELCQGKKYYKCLTKRCSEGNIFYSAMAMLEAYMRKYVIKPLKLVDHFIFVSRFARDKHIEFVPQYGNKSSHLYNMTEGEEKPEVVRGKYILYFGRLSKEKGLSTLFKAMDRVSCELWVVGSGPMEEEVRTITHNSQPKTHNIKFLGFKKNSELTNLIRNSAFVVVPSEWYENNPMTIVEAFSMGKPVIGANIGGIPELVNEETGFLFESGNKKDLARVIKMANNISDEEYQRRAIACYGFHQGNFNKKQHLQNLINTYKNQVS